MKNQKPATSSNASTLGALDWNFDAVPDKELAACCYWEYARESAFFRDLRQRCIDCWRKGGRRDQRLSSDLTKVHSGGPALEVLMRGFYFAPGDPHRIDPARFGNMTNNFPAPWQSLSENERDFRVRTLLNAGWYPAKPFERAEHLDAKDIAEKAEAKWEEIFSVYHRLRREYPGTSEVELRARGLLPPFEEIPVSVLREDGREIVTIAINWARFTNDEIAVHFRKWLKANRPKNFRPRDRKGHNKARDRRVILERLAMMRLLHQFPLGEMKEDFPAGWGLYQKRDWYKERKRAGESFHQLFPFLAKTDRPLSWPTKGGRSR